MRRFKTAPPKLLPLLVNNFKVLTRTPRAAGARKCQYAQKVASQWMHTLDAIMRMPAQSPESLTDQQLTFEVPVQVKQMYAPFRDAKGNESMVVPFLKEVTKANQLAMKFGCASVALSTALLNEHGITHFGAVADELDKSIYILKRCQCWFAALEEM